MRRLAEQFQEGAQIIKLPFTLESLENSKVELDSLERECQRMESLDAQVMSAIFVDEQDAPILAYCAYRAVGAPHIPKKVS